MTNKYLDIQMLLPHIHIQRQKPAMVLMGRILKLIFMCVPWEPNAMDGEWGIDVG